MQRLGVVLIIATLSGGCSGGDDSAANPTIDTTNAASVTTIAAPSTTAQPAMPSTSVRSTTPLTYPPTTAAISTTIEPRVAVLGQALVGRWAHYDVVEDADRQLRLQ